MSVRLNASMPMFIMRQMNIAQNSANVSMQRLASGLRINSAADDAAGLAIATGMTSEIQGYNQSIRNANDGISLLQTAEGTLSEVNNVLQRMRELTVQAGNDTNSKLNRASIQQEIDMLAGGIEDMMKTATFNGIDLFSGNNSGLNIGIEGGDVGLSVGGFNYQALALNGKQNNTGFSGGRVVATNINNAAININGVDIVAIVGDTQQKVTSLNNQLNQIGLIASGSNQVIGTAGTGITDGLFTINGDQVASSANMQQLVKNINRDVGGIVASVDGDGLLLLTNDTGQEIIIDNQGNEAGTGLVDDTYQGVISFINNSDQEVNITLNDSGTQADLDALGLMVTGDNYLQSQTITGNAVSSAEKFLINGKEVLIKANVSNAYEIAQAFNSASADVTVSANTEVLLSAPDFTQSPTGATDIRINGQAIDLTVSSSLDDTILKINTQLSNSGIVASATSDGQLSLVSNLGYDIIIEQDSGDFLQTGIGSTTFHGKLVFQSDTEAIQITSGLSGQANKEAALAKIGLSDTGGFTDVISGLDVSSNQNASQTLETLDNAINKVANERSSYGAQQNRLLYTIDHLETMSINTAAARSRIMDTDYAAESTALAKNQLLLQASTAMLTRFQQMHQDKILSLLNSL
ncbi:MAG: hypothetical protein GY787_17670 [Alteromonadales bacterium]|nr:hypothetical protein [Alteromonadales bacterium]